MKKCNGKHIARVGGDTLGDVDVLVADVHRKEVIAVETKSLATALTPAELSNEVNNLFGGRPGHRGDLEKFSERVSWLQEHLEDVLREFRFDAAERLAWSVVPLVVLDRDLFSPYLTTAPFPVITFRAIQTWVDSLHGIRHETRPRS